MPRTSVFTRSLSVKVPRIIALFWLIKILSTSVGEAFADYLNEGLGYGLTKTALLMAGVMTSALVTQISLKRYVPIVYWTTIALVSITGTLITDYLSDGMGVPLTTSSTIFAIALAITFAVWRQREHRIHERRYDFLARIHPHSPSRRFYW